MDIDIAEQLKSATAGMMKPDQYQALYELARDQSRSNIIDVGTGQGATTIAYALGVRDSRREARVYAVDQFYQGSAERPHRYTKRTNPDDCIELNIAVFEEHLRTWGVREIVDVHVGKTTDVASDLPANLSCDLLSIDVDGHIDRHLGCFYDFVDVGGLIVLDDYADRVDRHGKQLIAEFAGMDEDQVRDYVRKLDVWHRRRLLGKLVLTYRITEYLESISALRREWTIRETSICRKTSAASFSTFDLSGIDHIDDRIVEEFVGACTEG